MPHVDVAWQGSMDFSMDSVSFSGMFFIGAHACFSSHILISYKKQIQGGYFASLYFTFWTINVHIIGTSPVNSVRCIIIIILKIFRLYRMRKFAGLIKSGTNMAVLSLFSGGKSVFISLFSSTESPWLFQSFQLLYLYKMMIWGQSWFFALICIKSLNYDLKTIRR